MNNTVFWYIRWHNYTATWKVHLTHTCYIPIPLKSLSGYKEGATKDQIYIVIAINIAEACNHMAVNPADGEATLPLSLCSVAQFVTAMA